MDRRYIPFLVFLGICGIIFLVVPMIYQKFVKVSEEEEHPRHHIILLCSILFTGVTTGLLATLFILKDTLKDLTGISSYGIPLMIMGILIGTGMGMTIYLMNLSKKSVADESPKYIKRIIILIMFCYISAGAFAALGATNALRTYRNVYTASSPHNSSLNIAP